MKNIINFLLLSVFVSLNAYAADMSFLPVGNFEFRGQAEVLSAKMSEMVEASSPKGKERIQDLKAQGWTCVAKYTNVTQCSVFLKNARPTLESLMYFAEKYENFRITFGRVDRVNLVDDADSLREYEVIQDVSMKNEIESKYTLLALQGGPNKLIVGLHGGLHLNAINAEKFAIFETYKVQEQNVLTTYSLHVFFTR